MKIFFFARFLIPEQKIFAKKSKKISQFVHCTYMNF